MKDKKKMSNSEVTLYAQRDNTEGMYYYYEEDVKEFINLILNQIESGDYSDVRSKFEQHIGKELLG